MKYLIMFMYLAIAQSKNFNLKRKFKRRSNNQIKRKHYKTNYPRVFPTLKSKTDYPTTFPTLKSKTDYPTTFPVNYPISCDPKFCKEWSDTMWCKCYNINDTDLYETHGCFDDDSVILC